MYLTFLHSYGPTTFRCSWNAEFGCSWPPQVFLTIYLSFCPHTPIGLWFVECSEYFAIPILILLCSVPLSIFSCFLTTLKLSKVVHQKGLLRPWTHQCKHSYYRYWQYLQFRVQALTVLTKTSLCSPNLRNAPESTELLRGDPGIMLSGRVLALHHSVCLITTGILFLLMLCTGR